jgi:hypothetical protein
MAAALVFPVPVYVHMILNTVLTIFIGSYGSVVATRTEGSVRS